MPIKTGNYLSELSNLILIKIVNYIASWNNITTICTQLSSVLFALIASIYILYTNNAK